MERAQGRTCIVFVVALVLVLVGGCGESGQPKKVRLTSGSQAEASVPNWTPQVPLRAAVAPVLSPRESFKLYAAMFDYISRRLDRPVQPLQRKTYIEINDLVRYGQADVAFVCDYAYIEGERSFGMQLLVAPVVMGSDRYHSYIIVPQGSDARKLDDLRGKSFAFSDPLSSSGWLFPTYLLRVSGERPDSFFKRSMFTYSHDNTVKAVAEKLVDGGAVDSLVYEFMVALDPHYGERTRVIEVSPPWGTPPVVVHPRIAPELRERLKRIFLTMHQDEEGKRALAPLLIDRFIPPDDRTYDSVRQMAALVGGRP